jgi:hypothetical protein
VRIVAYLGFVAALVVATAWYVNAFEADEGTAALVWWVILLGWLIAVVVGLVWVIRFASRFAKSS